MNVIQYNEYYPFGLQTANSWTRENVTGNNFLGNGGTELNTTSNLYDLDYRNYDPILGRMNGVDPMATKYASLTPYNFSFNDPVTFNDPSGADPDYGITRYTYDDRVDHYRGEFYSGGSTSALRFHYGGGGGSGIINWSYAPSFSQLSGMQNAAAAAHGNSQALMEYGLQYGTSYSYEKFGSIEVGGYVSDKYEWLKVNQQTKGGSVSDFNWSPWITTAGGVNTIFEAGNAISLHQISQGEKLVRLAERGAYTGAKTFGKVLGGVGVGLTAASLAYEYNQGKSNTHSIVNGIVTGGSFLVGAIAVTVGAPVVAIGAAGVGIGYGLFSIFGGDQLINNLSNDWGSKVIYNK